MTAEESPRVDFAEAVHALQAQSRGMGAHAGTGKAVASDIRGWGGAHERVAVRRA